VKKTRLLLIFLPLIAAAGAGLWWWRSSRSPATRQDSAEAILGHVRSSQSQLVLVNFWASWCEPCKEELPALWELKGLYPENNLKIVLVSIDDPDEIEAAAGYLRDNKMEFTTFYKGAQPLKFVSRIFPNWSGSVPATVLMNSRAEIVDSWEGDATLEELKARVKKQLRGS
jgi:thiol-disulfide isomerase/thioredoxin